MKSFVGGARVGFMNASWPLATLKCSKAELVLDVKMIGEFRLRPEDVAALEVIDILPLVGRGVRIRHVRKDIATRLTFACFQKPQEILAEISTLGFVPKASLDDLPSDAFPLRIPFLLTCFVLWNAGFALDRLLFPGPFLGPGAMSALALLLFTSLFLPRFSWLQRFSLRSPDDLGRVKPALRLCAMVAALLLLAALLVSFAPGP